MKIILNSDTEKCYSALYKSKNLKKYINGSIGQKLAQTLKILAIKIC